MSLMKFCFPLLLLTIISAPGSASAQVVQKRLTTDEVMALKLLCRIAAHDERGPWKSPRINAAIGALVYGKQLPDDAQDTAYKACTSYGGMKK